MSDTKGAGATQDPGQLLQCATALATEASAKAQKAQAITLQAAEGALNFMDKAREALERKSPDADILKEKARTLATLARRAAAVTQSIAGISERAASDAAAAAGTVLPEEAGWRTAQATAPGANYLGGACPRMPRLDLRQ